VKTPSAAIGMIVANTKQGRIDLPGLIERAFWGSLKGKAVTFGQKTNCFCFVMLFAYWHKLF
jgi:hypothetical protein